MPCGKCGAKRSTTAAPVVTLFATPNGDTEFVTIGAMKNVFLKSGEASIKLKAGSTAKVAKSVAEQWVAEGDPIWILA